MNGELTRLEEATNKLSNQVTPQLFTAAVVVSQKGLPKSWQAKDGQSSLAGAGRLN